MIYVYAVLFVLAVVFVFAKVRKDGKGEINRKHIAIGTAASAGLIAASSMFTLKSFSVGGTLIYFIIPSAVYLLYKVKPRIFYEHEKYASWILAGYILVMFSLGIRY